MGAMCQVRIAPEGTGIFLSVCGMGGSGLGGLELIDMGGGESYGSAFSLGRKGNEVAHSGKLGPDFGGLRH